MMGVIQALSLEFSSGAINFFASEASESGNPTGSGEQSSLKPWIDPEQVTPGTLGFVVVFSLAIAVIVLSIFMTRSIRKVRYQAYFHGVDEGDQPSEIGEERKVKTGDDR